MVSFSVYVVWPSGLSLSNLQVLKKIHNKSCEKDLYPRKNYISAKFYIPGLVLKGLQTFKLIQAVYNNLTWHEPVIQ